MPNIQSPRQYIEEYNLESVSNPEDKKSIELSLEYLHKANKVSRVVSEIVFKKFALENWEHNILASSIFQFDSLDTIDRYYDALIGEDGIDKTFDIDDEIDSAFCRANYDSIATSILACKLNIEYSFQNVPLSKIRESVLAFCAIASPYELN